MLIIPDIVNFGPLTLDNIQYLAVDRASERLATEWTDAGPHAVFADVPEQRVTVRLSRRIIGQAPAGVVPGQRETLTADFAPGGSGGKRRRLTVSAVVTSVDYQFAGADAASGSARSTRQSITLIALSPDGATDPVTIQDL